MDTIYFNNPKIIICEWLPMGTNNMIALNRHLGAHKQYNASTAFGMKGEVQSLEDGKFQMKDSGCFLQPVDFSFSKYLKANMKSNYFDSHAKGLEIDKDGACYVGMDYKMPIEVAKTKDAIGIAEVEFAAQFLPVLTETQLGLLKCAYGTNNDEKLSELLSTYALVIADSIDVEIKLAKDFVSSDITKNILTPVTDWITDCFSADGCHIFIGMKAMVCIGNPQKELIELLRTIVFQKTMFNISLNLYSTMWGTMKTLKNMGSTIPKSNYKVLKVFNNDLANLQNDFSKQKIVCEQIQKTIKSKLINFELNTDPHHPFFQKSKEEFETELEKAEDRNILTDQMSLDIQGLRDQLQQRMSLIMTKNGQRLNLILLVLTVISVIGIGEVLGFSIDKIILVVLVLTPFAYIVIKSFIQYKRDFE